MDIKQHPEKRRTTALVTFNTLEERRKFGANAPGLSAEHQRYLTYVTRAVSPWGLLVGNQYHADSEFPQTVEIPYRVVGSVAAHLSGEIPASRSEPRAVQEEIFKTITDHLEGRRQNLLERFPAAPDPDAPQPVQPAFSGETAWPPQT